MRVEQAVGPLAQGLAEELPVKFLDVGILMALADGLALILGIESLAALFEHLDVAVVVGLASTTDAEGNAKQGLWLGAGAQIGLEYFFDSIPLQLSLDWKPSLLIIPGLGFGWNSIAPGIRYAF